LKTFVRVNILSADLSGLFVPERKLSGLDDTASSRKLSSERKLSGLVVTATARKLSSKEKTTFKESSGHLFIVVVTPILIQLFVEYNCFAAIRYQVDEHIGDDCVEPLI